MEPKIWEIAIVNPNLIKISGDLNFKTVAAAKVNGEKLLDSISNAKIDLSEVKRIDSSCLSFLMSLLRYAKAKHKVLEFINLPSRLINLSRVSGVDEILPIGKT